MIVFINQIRMRIGIRFGSPETTTGGNAIKFYASVRLDLRSIGKVNEGGSKDADGKTTGGTIVANKTRVRVIKNKVADPFTEAEFQIKFGIGIDRATEVIELGVATGVIAKSGAWLSYGDSRLGQGRAKVADMFREDPKFMEALAGEVAEALENVGAVALTTAQKDDGDEVTGAKPPLGKKQTTSTAAAVAALSKKTPKK